MTQIPRLRYPLLPPLRILDSFHLRATAAIATVAARLHTIMPYSVARAHREAASSNSSNAAGPSPSAHSYRFTRLRPARRYIRHDLAWSDTR
ncbi:hypothetical protein DTO063F5_5891 [Paecilomyces variotii]|nr:hypothetical protein DTO063F5_5891 [Paecilomyces variotii]